MVPKLEYHRVVKTLNRAMVVRFGWVVCGLAFSVWLQAPAATAQINAAPPSVASMGFGGRAINGTPPSVTSLGPHGYSRGFNPNFPNSRPSFNSNRRYRRGYYPWGGVYAVPSYGYDDSYDSPNESAGDQYNGGPTIFDRRGSGSVARPPASYDTSARGQAQPTSEPTPESDAAPAADQPQTVLVFKDGHQLEVENYAIVGSTLYDLTEGRSHKIALADLDLTATSKQNDARGIDFQLPSHSEAN
jgi:hypothetical protein